jgi:hypothetical protein
MIDRSGDRTGQVRGGVVRSGNMPEGEGGIRGLDGPWGGLGDRSIVDAMRSYRVHNSVAWYGNAPERRVHLYRPMVCIDRR